MEYGANLLGRIFVEKRKSGYPRSQESKLEEMGTGTEMINCQRALTTGVVCIYIHTLPLDVKCCEPVWLTDTFQGTMGQ